MPNNKIIIDLTESDDKVHDDEFIAPCPQRPSPSSSSSTSSSSCPPDSFPESIHDTHHSSLSFPLCTPSHLPSVWKFITFLQPHKQHLDPDDDNRLMQLLSQYHNHDHHHHHHHHDHHQTPQNSQHQDHHLAPLPHLHLPLNLQSLHLPSPSTLLHPNPDFGTPQLAEHIDNYIFCIRLAYAKVHASIEAWKWFAKLLDQYPNAVVYEDLSFGAADIPVPAINCQSQTPMPLFKWAERVHYSPDLENHMLQLNAARRCECTGDCKLRQMCGHFGDTPKGAKRGFYVGQGLLAETRGNERIIKKTQQKKQRRPAKRSREEVAEYRAQFHDEEDDDEEAEEEFSYFSGIEHDIHHHHQGLNSHQDRWDSRQNSIPNDQVQPLLHHDHSSHLHHHPTLIDDHDDDHHHHGTHLQTEFDYHLKEEEGDDEEDHHDAYHDDDDESEDSVNDAAKYKVSRRKSLALEAQALIEECNSDCPCPLSCSNRLVQFGRRFPILVKYDAHKGWSAFALSEIPMGSFVSEYTGELISVQIAQKRAKQPINQDISYLFDIDFVRSQGRHQFSLDARYHGNESRFFNHSCNPNLVVRTVLCDVPDVMTGRIAFFARSDIAPLDELTFNYGYKISRKGKILCHCGAPNCKKYLM